MSDIDLDAIMARANAAAPVAWIDSRGTFQSHYAADVPRLVAEVRDQREVIAGLQEAVTALRHARDRQRDLRLGLLAANEALVEAVDAEAGRRGAKHYISRGRLVTVLSVAALPGPSRLSDHQVGELANILAAMPAEEERP